jgi:hypothetical protein
VAVGKLFRVAFEELQTVKEITHENILLAGERRLRARIFSLKAAAPAAALWLSSFSMAS